MRLCKERNWEEIPMSTRRYVLASGVLKFKLKMAIEVNRPKNNHGQRNTVQHDEPTNIIHQINQRSLQVDI